MVRPGTKGNERIGWREVVLLVSREMFCIAVIDLLRRI